MNVDVLKDVGLSNESIQRLENIKSGNGSSTVMSREDIIKTIEEDLEN